jgi:hypothetical protein
LQILKNKKYILLILIDRFKIDIPMLAGRGIHPKPPLRTAGSS